MNWSAAACGRPMPAPVRTHARSPPRCTLVSPRCARGSFSIADAFYAPVVTRFATYGVTLPPRLAAFAQAVVGLPAMRAWIDAAHAEPEVLVDH